MTIEIESNIPENILIENLLNMKHSGVDNKLIGFILSIHAFANHWHIDKIFYYSKLLGIERRKTFSL